MTTQSPFLGTCKRALFEVYFRAVVLPRCRERGEKCGKFQFWFNENAQRVPEAEVLYACLATLSERLKIWGDTLGGEQQLPSPPTAQPPSPPTAPTGEG